MVGEKLCVLKPNQQGREQNPLIYTLLSQFSDTDALLNSLNSAQIVSET